MRMALLARVHVAQRQPGAQDGGVEPARALVLIGEGQLRRRAAPPVEGGQELGRDVGHAVGQGGVGGHGGLLASRLVGGV